MMCYQGRNRVSLAGTDERTFVVALQLARQLTMQQVRWSQPARQSADTLILH